MVGGVASAGGDGRRAIWVCCWGKVVMRRLQAWSDPQAVDCGCAKLVADDDKSALVWECQLSLRVNLKRGR